MISPPGCAFNHVSNAAEVRSGSKWSARLGSLYLAIGLALDGEAGACLVADLGLSVSPDTLLRLTTAAPLAASPTPRVLGVDDWSWCKGGAGARSCRPGAPADDRHPPRPPGGHLPSGSRHGQEIALFLPEGDEDGAKDVLIEQDPADRAAQGGIAADADVADPAAVAAVAIEQGAQLRRPLAGRETWCTSRVLRHFR